MTFRWLPMLSLSMLLATAWGCVASDCASKRESCPAKIVQACQVIEPSVLTPDLSLISFERLSPVDGLRRYCALFEKHAQCQAAKNSTRGNLYAKEAQVVTAEQTHFDHGSELAGQVLLLVSKQKRNEDAATALTVFWRLLEAEAGAQNVLQRLQVSDTMLADIGRMQEGGMLSPVSRSEVEGRRLELQHTQANVLGNIDQLNHQLSSLVAIELTERSRFWPVADLLVHPELPDRTAAVQLAISNRADLQALRLAANADEREAATAARVLLAPLGLGSSSSSPGCLKKLIIQFCGSAESAERSEQLRMAYHQQKRTVTAETEEAIDLMRTRLTQIILTRERLQLAHGRLKAIEQQGLPGAASNRRQPLLDVLAVEQSLMHDTVEWKLAEIKLRAAQGLLADECGY